MNWKIMPTIILESSQGMISPSTIRNTVDLKEGLESKRIVVSEQVTLCNKQQ